MENQNKKIDKLEAHRKIRSRIQVIDAIFHPTEDIIALGLVNGKLKL